MIPVLWLDASDVMGFGVAFIAASRKMVAP